MEFLRDWIEELQTRLRSEERHTGHLEADLCKVRSKLADRSRACNELAASRDAVATTLNETQAELDKLRQSRARERAAPAPDGLLVECRDALLAHGGMTSTVSRRVLNRLDGAIAAAEPSDRQLVDGPPLVADPALLLETVVQERDELRGRVAFMDTRVKELSDQLADAKDALADTLKERNDTVHKLEADLDEARAHVQVAMSDRRRLEEQAEGYRKTITKLRLTPGDRTTRRFEGAGGPDIRDANHVDAGGEAAGFNAVTEHEGSHYAKEMLREMREKPNRYIVQVVPKRLEDGGGDDGYAVWDTVERKRVNAWLMSDYPEMSLDEARGYAQKNAALHNGREPVNEAANRGGM